MGRVGRRYRRYLVQSQVSSLPGLPGPFVSQCLPYQAHPTYLTYPAHLTYPTYPAHLTYLAYSYLNASMGLTRLARSAGSHTAVSATRLSASGMPTKTAGSRA
jgi:hypothetical protein